MLVRVEPRTLLVVLDVIAWGVCHAGTGYVAHRLGVHRLARDGWLLRLRPFEADGRWYRRWRIDRWKDRVPEAGDLFAGGVSKRHLPGVDQQGLHEFVLATRRAELGHWMALLCGPVFVLFNPPLAAGLLVGYGVVVNLPFIMIQRYNRGRTLAILARRAGQS